MKKKIITLACLAAAVIILLLVYAGAKKNNAQKPDANPEPEVVSSGQYKLVSLDIADVKEIDTGKVVFEISDDGISVKDRDMSLLDEEKIVLEINALTNISSDNEVEKDCKDTEKYDLEKFAQCRVTYTMKDDSTKQFEIGALTPDGEYYYALSDNNVYTIGKTTGDRIMQDVTELADLSMDILDPNALTMLEVTQKGRDDLRVSFDSKNEITNESSDKSGLATLIMHSPIENLIVYPYNLESGLLYNYASFKLTQMVDFGSVNFSEYGLDDPVMKIAMADSEKSVTLAVGNLAEDGSEYYVTPYGNAAVYTMPKEALEPFFNYDIINFIQKFIALHYRYELSDIDIKSAYGDYTVEFKEEGDKKLTEENGSYKDKRQEYINGKAVDSEKFVDYYELLVGLTFDALKEYETTGEPQAEISYHLLDGSEDKVVFYDYDDTFFAAVKGDEQQKMLINKQQVKQAIDKAKELLD